MRLASMVIALVLAMLTPALAQQVPVLHYTPPSDAYKDAINPPDDYRLNGMNASVQVYPFRKFTGDIVQTYQQTLLRDWIDVRYQEENVAGQPQFARLNIPGAQLTITATFAENRVGIARPHTRMLIIAGDEAAIVDASAGDPQSWGRAVGVLNAMANTLRVDAAPAPPDVSQGPGPQGRLVAGLYMGTKPKYMASMVNVTGSGYYQVALHFYLFSAEGRVYRAYDKLDVPGGNPSQFDFDGAEQRDAMNSGRYTIANGQLYIQMEGPRPQVITAALPKDGMLTIESVLYKRR